MRRFTGHRLQAGTLLALTALLASAALPVLAAGGKKGEKTFGGHGMASLEQADKLFAANKFSAARDAYQAALKAAPRALALHVGLVRTLIRLDDWQGAIRAGEKAISAVPMSSDAHGILSLALLRGGRPEAAEAQAKRASTLDPKSYWGLVASGRIALWNAQKSVAYKALKTATELRPNWPEAWYYLMDSLESGQEKEEYQAARAYLALDPKGHPHDRTVEGLEGSLEAMSRFDKDSTFKMENGPLSPSKLKTEDDLKNAKEGKSEPKTISMTFPIERNNDDILIPVYMNGGRFKLLFDTGAGDSLSLGRDAADRLSLPTLGNSVVRGVSGKETTHISKVDKLEIGQQTFRSVPLDFIDNNIGTAEDGLIGGGVLQEFAVTVDFENNMMTVARGKDVTAPAPMAGDRIVRVPFHMQDGYILLPIKTEGKLVWAMLDTGAQGTTLLSLNLARQLAATRPDTTTAEVEVNRRVGVGISSTTFTALLFRFGVEVGLLNGNKTVYFGDIDPIYGASMMDTEVSRSFDFQLGAIVGISYLARARRVTFDYPHRMLTLEFRDVSSDSNAASP